MYIQHILIYYTTVKGATGHPTIIVFIASASFATVIIVIVHSVKMENKRDKKDRGINDSPHKLAYTMVIITSLTLIFTLSIIIMLIII